MYSSSPRRTRSFWKGMGLLWTVSCCVKILLVPSYHSTDLLVHRHWKAVTRHTAVANWYFDDDFVPNRHTLDYPPGFAWFEAFWSHVLSPERWSAAMTTSWRTSNNNNNEEEDEDDNDTQYQHWSQQCLQLLPSDDYQLPPSSSSSSYNNNNDTTTLTMIQNDAQLIAQYPACKLYLRATVVLSDVILWLGAWCLSAAAVPAAPWTTFMLLVFHPALLWLDHVHFQYNGLLLGIWMLSLACLVQGRQQHQSSRWFDIYHLGAASLFALLLTLKHLYLPLALWYTVYLFRRYCCVDDDNNIIDKDAEKTNANQLVRRIHWTRLVVLGMVTVGTLLLPIVPIFWSSAGALHTPAERATRLFERLFPFQRGLVHDYWAGNIWAFYVAAQKVLRYALRLDYNVLPTITPGVATMAMIAAVTPGAVFGAWRAAATGSNLPTSTTPTPTSSGGGSSTSDSIFWMSLVWTTLSAFATAYHGHEKAIVTSLIPLTIWAMQQQQQSKAQHSWLWQTHAFALVSLLPLLYPATETLLKLTSMVLYLAVLYQITNQGHTHQPAANHHSEAGSLASSWQQKMLPTCVLSSTHIAMFVLAVTVILLDGVPVQWWGRFSFAPLAITSLVSAAGLSIWAWGNVGWCLWQAMTIGTT